MKVAPVLTQVLCHEGVWGMEVWLHVFLTSPLDGGDWSSSRPDRLIPWKEAPSTH
jgi:hypothetical protein